MNYGRVKETILSAYDICAETYRRRFQHVQRGEGEAYVQLEVQQNNLPEKRLKVEGVSNVEGVKQIIQGKQLLASVPPDLEV